MKDAIGLVIPHLNDAIVTKQIMLAYCNQPSSFYEAKVEGQDEPIIVHQNIVEGILDGTYVPEAPKVKGERKRSTKKQRAAKHVLDCKRKRMSRGETIKYVAQKLRCSRATAQTYYYQVK